MSKIYSIDMVLRPGILSIGPEGKNVYIDSPENIKALVGSGIFNKDILNYLNDSRKGKVLQKLNFKVTTIKNSNTLKVRYETADINQGMDIQNRLSKLLIKEYAKLVQDSEREYDIKSSLLTHQIDLIKANIQSYIRNMANIEKRIDELILEIKLIKNKTANLVAEKNKLSSKNPKENNGLQVLFYTYLIQENVKLSNNYLNKINDYKFKKEKQLQNIRDLEYEKEKKIYDLKEIQYEKGTIQNIQILQAPTKSPYPVKPKTILNVALALVVGFLFFGFLSFFLEYLSRHKSPKNV